MPVRRMLAIMNGAVRKAVGECQPSYYDNHLVTYSDDSELHAQEIDGFWWLTLFSRHKGHFAGDCVEVVRSVPFCDGYATVCKAQPGILWAGPENDLTYLRLED